MTDVSGVTPAVVPAGITQTVVDAALKAYSEKLVADAKAQAKQIDKSLRANTHTAMAIAYAVGTVVTLIIVGAVKYLG